MEHQDAKRRSNRALVRFYSAARSRPATTQEGGGCVRARKRSQQLRETHGRPGMGRWLSTSDRRTTLPRRVAGRRQPVCSSGTAAGTVVGCGCLRGQKVPTTRSQRDRSAMRLLLFLLLLLPRASRLQLQPLQAARGKAAAASHRGEAALAASASAWRAVLSGRSPMTMDTRRPSASSSA